MSTTHVQLDPQGRLLHFLTVEGLTRRHLTEILDTAESLHSVAERRVKKLPTLHGKTVVNLFFEASTRTRTTFELAAKRLSAEAIRPCCRIRHALGPAACGKSVDGPPDGDSGGYSPVTARG